MGAKRGGTSEHCSQKVNKLAERTYKIVLQIMQCCRCLLQTIQYCRCLLKIMQLQDCRFLLQIFQSCSCLQIIMQCCRCLLQIIQCSAECDCQGHDRCSKLPKMNIITAWRIFSGPPPAQTGNISSNRRLLRSGLKFLLWLWIVMKMVLVPGKHRAKVENV